MNSTSFKLAAATALLMLGGTSLASATTISTGDGTTGSGPYELVSNGTFGDSFVHVDLTSAITFSSIASLSVGFTDVTGGAENGSPRLVLGSPGGNSFWVYLGTPPSFNNNVAGLQGFSGANLNNGTNNTAFNNGNPYQSIAALQALHGADPITFISFQVDGAAGANGPQDIILDSLILNGTDVLAPAAPVPEPITLSLFGVGVVGAAALRRRKAKKA